MDRLSPERRISLLRAVKIAILHRSYASEGSFIDSDIDFASYEMNAIESSKSWNDSLLDEINHGSSGITRGAICRSHRRPMHLCRKLTKQW